MNRKLKDLAEIKLIPFMELKPDDIIILKNLFLDLTNGITSEREYFHRATQGASIFDVYFKNDYDFIELNFEEMPILGVNLNLEKKDNIPQRKNIYVPKHIEEMRSKKISGYSFLLGTPASVNLLDEMNNLNWFRRECWVMRETAPVQHTNQSNTTGILPFCLTSAIKNSTHKCNTDEECIDYVLNLEIDLDLIHSLQQGNSNQEYKEFQFSELGNTFHDGHEKWNEALVLVKKTDTTFNELGDALTANSPFAHKGEYLKKLNQALGALFLSKEDFWRYIHSGEVDRYYYIDQDANEAEPFSLVLNQNWFKQLLIDRGILALDALSEVKDLFRSIRIGPHSSALARIFAHLLLRRLPDKKVLLTRHDINMKDFFQKNFFDEHGPNIERGEKSIAGARKAGENQQLKKMARKDKYFEKACRIMKEIQHKNSNITFTASLVKAAKQLSISRSTLANYGLNKKSYEKWEKSNP